MRYWFVGLVVWCGLIMGCGGGPKGGVVATDLTPPEAMQAPVEGDQEEFLTEVLPAKRLEELYAKSGLQGIDPTLEDELKKWDQRLKFDVPIHVNKQVKAYLVYFSTERKSIITRYLSRSSRYLPMIREIFQEHGLPEDLAYLAMVESGFNPNAYSHAHACGMWQFIKGTGLRYNLEINNYLDERRDPEKSTHAAARYLLDLYKQFGSWYLAAASYNCGEGRVQREINQSSHKNFWELSANQCLPSETKNYVPQMIAATIIAKNPEKFGFKNVPYLPPLKFETVRLEETTSLRAAAVACNVPVEEIQALNPELRRGMTPPPGVYTLKLPKGAKELFARNIAVARIELPAVAAVPVRTAKASSRRPASEKDTSEPKTAAVKKSTGKAASVAMASAVGSAPKGGKTEARGKKKEVRTARADATSKAKASNSDAGKSGVAMASILGGKTKTAESQGAEQKANKNSGKEQKKTAKKSTGATSDKRPKDKDKVSKRLGKPKSLAQNKSSSKGKASAKKTRTQAGTIMVSQYQ